jgi:uncharacterized protein (TIGR00251 family)
VRVTPKGGRDEIIGVRETSDGRHHLAVKIASPPENGAANEALRRLIADAAGLGRSAITIVAGAQAREKRLKLTGDPVAILASLQRIGITE